MESIKRDIRLYQYTSGQLEKIGKGKNTHQPHLFTELDTCIGHVDHLVTKYPSRKTTQFVIVEYFGPNDSRIISIL
jgi:hypothetical protein